MLFSELSFKIPGEILDNPTSVMDYLEKTKNREPPGKSGELATMIIYVCVYYCLCNIG